MRGIGVPRNDSAALLQVTTKSYRPCSNRHGGFGEVRNASCELLGPGDERIPDRLGGAGVEGGEHIAPPRVEDCKDLTILCLGAPRQRRRRRYRRQLDAHRPGQRLRRGEPDAQSRERAGSGPDRNPLHRIPASGRRRGLLDLDKEAGRVLRPAGGRLHRAGEEQYSITGRGDRGVVGGGVESDYAGHQAKRVTQASWGSVEAMPKATNRALAVLVGLSLTAAGAAWSGCGSEDVNDAADKAREKINEAGDKASDAAEDAKNKANHAVDTATGDDNAHKDGDDGNGGSGY